MVLPPDSIILDDKSFIQSGSHFNIDYYVNSWMPGIFMSFYIKILIKDGLKRASGHLKRSCFISI